MNLTGVPFFTFRKLISNIHQQNDYKNKSHGDLYISINFPEIVHFSNILSSSIVTSKQTIPKKTEIVNEINSGILLGKLILGPIKAAANQAAEILIDNAESALRSGRNLFFLIRIILASVKKSLLNSIMK